MSPSGFAEANDIAFEWYQSSAGNLTNGWYVAGLYGARPVINLKPNSKITGGIGTVNDPYVIE